MIAQLLVTSGFLSPRGMVIAAVCLLEFVLLCALAMTLVKSTLSEAAYRSRHDLIKVSVALFALALISISLPSNADADSAQPVVAATAR